MAFAVPSGLSAMLPSGLVSGPLPPLMKTGRGAHSATSSFESTGRSFQWPAYFRKLPAIQWYSLAAATLSTVSPYLRR